MQRRLIWCGMAAFGGAVGHTAAADAKTTTAAAAPAAIPAKPNLAAAPIKLDRRNAQLRLVQVVFRHGARTPLTDASYLWEGHEWNVCGCAYKAVPLQLLDIHGGPATTNAHDQKQMSTVLPGGCSKGQLTLVGQLQALELGYWLRQQYIDTHSFLPASYTPGVLAARTTNFSRTRGTMAGVLTGLYPGLKEPVPVVTSGDLDEILYADTKRCPHLKVLMAASEAMLKAHWKSPSQSPAIQQLQQTLDKFFKLPEGSWQRRWMFTDIYDAIKSMGAHGKQLPTGLTEEITDEVDKMAVEEISAFICPALVDEHGKAVMRLSMGRLLDTLLGNMTQAIQQNDSSGSTAGGRNLARLRLYSGHDSTIMPLLTALGVDIKRWPPYISNLVFELWELKPPTLNPRSNMGPSSTASNIPGVDISNGNLSSSAGGSNQAASSSTSTSTSSVVAPSMSTSSDSAGQRASDQASGPYVVRVLYNKQPLHLPGASQANPCVLELQDFHERVLSPFILSEEQHAQACALSVSHDSALPQPEHNQLTDLNLSSPAAATEKVNEE